MCIEVAKRLRQNRNNFRWVNDDEATVLATILEADHAGDLREEGVILPAADVQTGLQWCATLTNDDAAAQDRLAAKHLYAEPLCV